MEKFELKKQRAGEKAAEFVKDGMVIGLGSGSTVYWTLKKLGDMVKEGMCVKGIPTSIRTEKWAEEFGVPITTFSENMELDLAIDGADEIDPQFQLIKGGGGSLVREKIVAAASKKLIIVADDSKLVSSLGKTPLPVEVIPFGYESAMQQISHLGCDPVLRMKESQPFVSDNANYILDCSFHVITDLLALHNKIKSLVGVVETGLFINMANTVIIGKTSGVEIEKKREV